MALRSIRPPSSPAARILQTYRTISTSSPRPKEPKVAHADSLARVRISQGEPFADGAKQKEGTVSGIPRSQEPTEGKCT